MGWDNDIAAVVWREYTNQKCLNGVNIERAMLELGLQTWNIQSSRTPSL